MIATISKEELKELYNQLFFNDDGTFNLIQVRAVIFWKLKSEGKIHTLSYDFGYTLTGLDDRLEYDPNLKKAVPVVQDKVLPISEIVQSNNVDIVISFYCGGTQQFIIPNWNSHRTNPTIDTLFKIAIEGNTPAAPKPAEERQESFFDKLESLNKDDKKSKTIERNNKKGKITYKVTKNPEGYNITNLNTGKELNLDSVIGRSLVKEFENT